MRDFFGIPLWSVERDYELFPIVIRCGSDLLRDESLEWCKENIRYHNWCFDPYVSGSGFECRFNDEEEAIMFKLKFSI